MDNSGWSKWNSQAIKIECTLNFKSTPDFGNGSAFVFRDFLKGATRRVKALGDDKTLLSGNTIYLEGIVQTPNNESLNIQVNHPGCLLVGDTNQQVDISLSGSTYAPAQNSYFASPTALSIVTNGTAKLGGADIYAGICAKNSVSGKIKLHGNLVTEYIFKDDISNYLLYDSTLRDLSDDDYGNQAAQDACFVVTVSPVGQEFFDYANLK
ncbi:MAG: hypothetical protein PHQ23_13450 [Candidatus Wallbacteria bacterium]|nr:hypothetical protein [Candidatus Wallbacteria bacterium]